MIIVPLHKLDLQRHVLYRPLEAELSQVDATHADSATTQDSLSNGIPMAIISSLQQYELKLSVAPTPQPEDIPFALENVVAVD